MRNIIRDVYVCADCLFYTIMKLLWFVLIVVAIICEVRCQTGNNIFCPTEYVYGPSTSSQRTAYVWSYNTNGIYPSEPLCLNANYDMVKRRCQDGFWYPKYVDNCYNFECPKSFIGFDKDKCFYQFSSPEAVCPDLSSIFARSGTHIVDSNTPIKPLARPFLCSYHAEEFLNISLTVTNRISVVLSFVKKLHLIVYFPEALETIRGKEAIYCYSSNVDIQLRINRKPVGLKKLHQSSYSDGHTRNFSVFEVDIEDDPTQYWCQIYETGEVRPVATERVVAYKRKLGNEYSLRMASRGGLDLLEELCETCRLMEVSSFALLEDLTEYVLHFTAEATDDVPTQFTTLKAELETRFAEYSGTVDIISLKSSEFCLPQNGSLVWSLTPIGSVALPLVICLDSNDNPISRTCRGSFLYGAEWETEKPCFKMTQVPEATKLLSEIVSRSKVNFRDLSNVASAPHNFSSVDVALMADGFKRTRTNSTLDFLKSMSKVMGLDQTVLRTSQKQYNSMDKILGTIDDVLIKNPMPIKPVIEENLSVITMRPFRDAVVGMAFYKRNRLRKILKSQTLQDLPLEGLEVVIVTSHDLLEALTRNFSRKEKEDFAIIITTFKNDNLFNDMNGFKKAGSRIISVIIPDFRSYLFAPIDLFLRPMASTEEIDCGFWDYGEAKQGTWSNMGGNFEGMFKNEMVHCSFTHLTHFALLVTSNETVTWPDESTSISPNMFHKSYPIAITMLLLAKYF